MFGALAVDDSDDSSDEKTSSAAAEWSSHGAGAAEPSPLAVAPSSGGALLGHDVPSDDPAARRARRADELEALEAIYGDDFEVRDCASVP